MSGNTESTSLKSPVRTGEVELLEFLAQRRACDKRDFEIAHSDARAFERGVRNGLLMAMPFWLALAWWLAS